MALARLHRHGELTAVWVPDPEQEAMRDLERCREDFKHAERRVRQRLTGFLLRHGRVYSGGRRWTQAHFRWLETQRFDHPAQQIVFQEYVDWCSRPRPGSRDWRESCSRRWWAGRWSRRHAV